LRLTDLMARIEEVTIAGRPESIEITGLTADSRAVEPGFLFAALPGSRADGRRFIPEALNRGAAAVLAPAGTDLPDTDPSGADVPLLTSAEPRAALAHMAAAFHGRQPATMAAVTGTNGKTSVAHFTQQIWTACGRRAASMGTLGLRLPDGTTRPTLTTPDPVTLHADLATLADAGVTHCILEASSHGLDQHRLDGVRLSAAAFTNLSRDHLDYHGTEERYLAAKRRLFADLLDSDGTAVLNADVAEYAAFAAVARGRVVSYGRGGVDIRLDDLRPTESGLDVTAAFFGQPVSLHLDLPGAFQAANALCAAGLAVACGESPAGVLEALRKLRGVPGRLQLAGNHPSGAAVFIDYAHTPDALANVLHALRPHAGGRLVVVFGCGGDRDRGKRPMMGKIAADLADLAIVTDDNPRSEPADAIRAEIMAAASRATEIGDRAEAIRHAVGLLAAGDVLVVAGKGHETGQIVGNTVLPFDDLLIAREALAALGGETS